jgi:hypothetical protein
MNVSRSKIRRVLHYVLLGFLLLVVWAGFRGTYRQYVLVPRLQNSFGFTATDIYLSSGSYVLKQYPQIRSIERGSPFELAGFQIDDIVISDNYPSFFNKLNSMDSNDEVTFTIGRAANPLDTSELAVRNVKLRRK